MRPPEPPIRGVSHVLWAHRARTPGADARNTVFYGDRAIGSRFTGRVEEQVRLGEPMAINPSIEGSAVATGFDTITIDEDDPFWRVFQVA